MQIPVIIPSKERSEIGNTWNLFEGATLVVHKSEKKDYKGITDELWLHDCDNLPLIRNYILKKCLKIYGEGAWVIIMDDDIKRTGKFTANSKGINKSIKTDPEEFLCEFKKQIAAADKKGFHLIGASPTNNKLFYSHNRRMSVSAFISGGIMAIKLTKLRFKPECLVRDDYEFTCQHIINGLGVLRLNYLWILPDYHKMAGGCNTYRNEQNEIESTDYLLKHYPSLIRRNPKKANEVLLVRKKRGK